MARLVAPQSFWQIFCIRRDKVAIGIVFMQAATFDFASENGFFRHPRHPSGGKSGGITTGWKLTLFRQVLRAFPFSCVIAVIIMHIVDFYPLAFVPS